MPSDNTPPTTLATDLRRLGFNRTADDLNDRIAEATRKRWSPTVLLEHLVGAQGLGKTLLAKNIAHQAVLAGHSALFTTAADLLLDLNGQETARALERRLRHYTRPALLVIDELGYLAYDARAADLLFQLVSRRYEHRSLLITTNLAFKHWDTVFPNASCAVALIDRLTHHVEILLIEGQSYRRREAEITQQQRSRQRRSRRRAPDNRPAAAPQ